MVISAINKTFTKIFGSRNERLVKSYMKRVALINPEEQQVRRMTDGQLRERTREFQKRIQDGAKMADLLPQVMATAREVMDRAVGIRNIFNPAAHFDAAKLPSVVRELYEQTKATMDATPAVGVLGHHGLVPGWMQVEIDNRIYEAVRSLHPLSRPPFRARPFDVQLIGGMVLGEGRIAEMKTGEGKTIVAPLACYVACIEGLQCHVVTVNDYLVQRDRDWVFPFYQWLGLTVGAIHPSHQLEEIAKAMPAELLKAKFPALNTADQYWTYHAGNALKAEAYHCHVVYGTNSEFGFDYLRDNMKLTTQEQVQKRRDFCIVDEIDSILIDEARTPLIISGPAHEDAPRYKEADDLARHLIQKQRSWDEADLKVQQCMMRIKGLEGEIRNTRDKEKIPGWKAEMKELEAKLPELEAARDKFVQYYEIEREKKAAHLTHDGIAEAQKVAGIGSFYVGNNIDMPHLLENALRAHVIYRRDHEYVVEGQEVIIVDEFTGRKMIGRQWSDGLHQAVEAKERVKIKQETQTLATVTIQNFFKMYKRLAGMTGTAITEATEFHDIYKLDVVCIPTNVAVVRIDRDDLIFLSEKDKWNAILDEIKKVHDVGRPVLVGTTSVENSEMLSQRLTKKYGIQHAVLNAKQHEREAHIVEHAGELGAVMIATNMAGRGTDIKLQPIPRDALVRHWQLRSILPADARPDMSDDELVRLAYRQMATTYLGLKPRDIEAMSDDEVKRQLLRHWVRGNVYIDDKKVDNLSADECMKLLDTAPEFLLHRLSLYTHSQDMGGLHIVGTERHESRRIDNQLRGRSGRQGDKGSSRFFISLEDPLMKMFAGKTTMAALSKLGMKEGDAIEHRWITRSVERAQRKVEERNFEIRKNLLEYDEVMEHQRQFFYGTRQDVLEGKNIEQLIFDYIGEAVADNVEYYKDSLYAQTQAAEWCRQELSVSVEPERLVMDDLAELQREVRKEAHGEARSVIDVTLGEYMSHDVPPEEWDLKGLQHWAMSQFSVDVKQNQLRQMNIDEVKDLLLAAAVEQIDRKDLSGIARFMDPLYGANDLAAWAQAKFGLELEPAKLAELTAEQATDLILGEARSRYARREIAYPIEFTLEAAFAAAQQDPNWAIGQLCAWVKQRYALEWTPEDVSKKNGQEIHQMLVAEAEAWLGKDGQAGKLDVFTDEAVKAGSPQAIAEKVQQRWGATIELRRLERASDFEATRDVVYDHCRAILRAELTQLERYVLLQILDAAWKDHLYAIDQLKDSVGLRGYAEKDPRIEYKREGSRLFRDMQKNVRDRVTELIFRARLTPNVQVRNVYAQQEASQAQAQSALDARQAASQGTAQQREAIEAADRAGGGGDEGGGRHLSRHERRARAAIARKGDKAGQFKDRKRRSR